MNCQVVASAMLATESESVTIASEIVSNLVNNGDKIDTTVAATTDEVEAFISPTFKVSL